MITRRWFLTLPVSCAAMDWPQWRGPARDGVLPAGSWPEPLPSQLTRKWSIDVGTGHACPILAGGAGYAFARKGEQEILHAFDPATGKVRWQQGYSAPYEMNSAATHHGKGPKSTPVFANGRIYTMGISGVLSCWDAAGKTVWRKEFAREFRETSPLYGTAMSPIVDEGQLIAHVGGNDGGALTAFNAATGGVRWKWAGDGPAYGSPIIGTFAGVRQVVAQTQQNIVGLSRKTGGLLWKLPFTTAYVQNSVTPLVYQDLLILSGLGNGTFAVRLKPSGPPETVWHNKDIGMYMNSPVLAGDTLYGFSNRNRGMYFAMDAKTGKVTWQGEGRRGDNAALVISGNLLFALNTSAELMLARLSPASIQTLKTYTVAQSETWAHPLVLEKGVIIKDLQHLTLWTF